MDTSRTLRIIAYILGAIAIMSVIYNIVLVAQRDTARKQVVAASAVYTRHLEGEGEHPCGSPPGNPRSALLDPKWLKCIEEAHSKIEKKVAKEIAAYR